MPDEDLESLRKIVYGKLDEILDADEDMILQLIEDSIDEYLNGRLITNNYRENIKQQIFNSIRRLDILQELLEDPDITEIMVNGYNSIFYEKSGSIRKWNRIFTDQTRLEDIAQKIAARSNKIINESSPILDTRLDDGSRVNIVLPPVAINGPVITIRKFYETPITIEKLIAIGSLTQEAAFFLKCAVRARYNIFVSGGTGSGKTTFLNALSNFIPEDERVITIEDSAELQIKKVKNLVRLEARAANFEGDNAISIRDLIKSSLRMRPDRIVVGEVRGAEALDMLQAMNTGHDGSLSTGHSNSTKDMLLRLETMVLMGMSIPVTAIRQQIASAVDLIVHLGRLRDKSRKVLEITEVLHYSDGEILLNPLYRFVEKGEENGKVIGELRREESELVNTDKMRSFGINSWHF